MHNIKILKNDYFDLHSPEMKSEKSIYQLFSKITNDQKKQKYFENVKNHTTRTKITQFILLLVLTATKFFSSKLLLCKTKFVFQQLWNLWQNTPYLLKTDFQHDVFSRLIYLGCSFSRKELCFVFYNKIVNFPFLRREFTWQELIQLKICRDLSPWWQRVAGTQCKMGTEKLFGAPFR